MALDKRERWMWGNRCIEFIAKHDDPINSVECRLARRAMALLGVKPEREDVTQYRNMISYVKRGVK